MKALPPSKPPAPPDQLDFFDMLTGKPVTVTGSQEIAPGVHVGAMPPEILPLHGFASMVRMPDGTIQVVAKTFRTHLKVTYDIARQLNIQCGERKESRAVYHTIKRLIWAGFVKHRRLGNSYLMDLDSFWRFWTACAKPGFWNKARLAKYKAARYGPEVEAEEEDDAE